MTYLRPIFTFYFIGWFEQVFKKVQFPIFFFSAKSVLGLGGHINPFQVSVFFLYCVKIPESR